MVHDPTLAPTEFLPNIVVKVLAECTSLDGTQAVHAILIDGNGMVHTPSHNEEVWADDRKVARSLGDLTPFDVCEYWHFVSNSINNTPRGPVEPLTVWANGSIIVNREVVKSPFPCVVTPFSRTPSRSWLPITIGHWSDLARNVFFAGFGVTCKRPDDNGLTFSWMKHYLSPLSVMPFLQAVHANTNGPIHLAQLTDLEEVSKLYPSQVEKWSNAGIGLASIAAWDRVGATLETAVTLTAHHINSHLNAIPSAEYWVQHGLDVNNLPAFLAICPKWQGPHPLNEYHSAPLSSTKQVLHNIDIPKEWHTYLEFLTTYIVDTIPGDGDQDTLLHDMYVDNLRKYGNPLAWPHNIYPLTLLSNV